LYIIKSGLDNRSSITFLPVSAGFLSGGNSVLPDHDVEQPEIKHNIIATVKAVLMIIRFF